MADRLPAVGKRPGNRWHTIFLRRGIFALLYTTLFICLPRVYLTLHYPTDILAGALVGALLGLAANGAFARSRFTGASRGRFDL